MRTRRRELLRCAAAVVMTAIAFCASAQSYPTRPINMIVPYPPGGQADAIPRITIEHMKGSLGQPIVIENVSGAGGTIGVGRIVRSTPNGYTIGLGSSQTNVNNGAVFSLPYDVRNDFEPIALLASSPLLIVVRKDLPVNSLNELFAWLKANHAKATQGHIGAGGGTHLCGIELQNKTGVQWPLVPYRGVGPAMQDMLAGQIDLMCATLGSTVTQVRAGQVKALAVTANRRLAAVPDLPTVDEAGAPGFYSAAWYCYWAPPGVPKDTIAKLNAATVAALADPETRRRISDLGLEIPPRGQQTPEYLGAYHKAEIEKWWPIIKAAGVKPE